ncbi:MAG TPA: helix-turn-helix domain-containing protein [Pyrinomonadaceae bacterium]|nr:helix-turn-helix domain-containing protein [Pyrinomonadaceae bacterium]
MTAIGKSESAAERSVDVNASTSHLKLLPRAPVKLPPGVPQYLNVEEVSTMLHLRPKTIYKMVSQRRIPFRKAGHNLLFDPKEIEAWTKKSADNQ